MIIIIIIASAALLHEEEHGHPVEAQLPCHRELSDETRAVGRVVRTEVNRQQDACTQTPRDPRPLEQQHQVFGLAFLMLVLLMNYSFGCCFIIIIVIIIINIVIINCKADFYDN